MEAPQGKVKVTVPGQSEEVWVGLNDTTEIEFTLASRKWWTFWR
ncbi:MAG: hypothetical protein AB1705_16380 [Verrucomicrobiota bacterium]